MRNLLTFLFSLVLVGCTSLDLEPQEFIAANVGKPYLQNVNVVNANRELAHVTILEGELPPGIRLLFDRRNKHFSFEGTPLKAGHYPFTISMGCVGTNFPGRTGSQKVAIEVYAEK